MTATTARAEFLKSAERFAVAESATLTARWGEDAADTSQSSPLVLEADAAAEAARQLAQLVNVLGQDLVVVNGVHQDLEGSTVSVFYNGRLGIAGSADLLVVKASINWGNGTTELEGFVFL